MMYRLLFCLLALCASAVQAQTNPDSVLAGSPCHGQTPCLLDGREYHVKEPDGWDGVTPLPVLLHFHGWARTGKLPVNHGRISGATRRRGVLLLAPTGLGKTWQFRREGSPDVDFANAVLADAATRYPIDPDQIYISGYSYGGLMAWRYACESGDSVRAVLKTTSCGFPLAPREKTPGRLCFGAIIMAAVSLIQWNPITSPTAVPLPATVGPAERTRWFWISTPAVI